MELEKIIEEWYVENSGDLDVQQSDFFETLIQAIAVDKNSQKKEYEKNIKEAIKEAIEKLENEYSANKLKLTNTINDLEGQVLSLKKENKDIFMGNKLPITKYALDTLEGRSSEADHYQNLVYYMDDVIERGLEKLDIAYKEFYRFVDYSLLYDMPLDDKKRYIEAKIKNISEEFTRSLECIKYELNNY